MLTPAQTERIMPPSSPCVSTYHLGAEHRPRSSEPCEGKSSEFAEHCSIDKYLLGTLCLFRYIWYLLEESRGRTHQRHGICSPQSPMPSKKLGTGSRIAPKPGLPGALHANSAAG
ncbi:hypothetical protein E5288_WYG021923 [Bos mutus]|uniref:Uncharacterized protein n=1 Tax=Bos mutus TaxID=72004 RepID=A0A6B0S1F8_9CETA|nr:hypothetical protein [Bos mutus]